MTTILRRDWTHGLISEGRRTALVKCPTCRGEISLSGHEINRDGRVLPSLVCPYPGCAFHDTITLETWTP